MITSNIDKGQLGNPLATQGDRIDLPFAYLRLFWHNGNAQAEPRGAKHYGGWFSGADDFQMDMAACGIEQGYFKGPETWVSREGKQYQAYSSRVVYAAPIATRLLWPAGKPSQLSILVYLAGFNPDTRSLFPLCPATLNAKSYAGKYVSDAFKKFVSDTAEVRLQVAKDIPVGMFYVPIGTHGDRQQIMVGKGKQSPIVPCDYAGDFDAELLEKHFVGDEIGVKMIELKALAAEWLADKPKENETSNDDDGFDLPPVMPMNDDDFPFPD